MLNRNNSLNNLLNNMQNLKHIIKDEEEEKLPSIKNDKIFIYNNDLNSLNNNNETTKSSNNIKNNKSNRIFIPVLKSSNRNINIPSTNTTSGRKLTLKKFKILSHLKKSSSAEKIIPYSVPNITDFHNKLMEQNQLSCKKRLKEEYLKYKNIKKSEDNLGQMLFPNRSDKKVKTGIYGPNDNIVSVIRARMERLKLDNEYRGVDEDLKELIKDEIMDAQVKLKMKPINLIRKKEERNPLFLKKLEKYGYLSKMNLIREINQVSITPLLVKDGNLMIRLINDAFDNFKLYKTKS